MVGGAGAAEIAAHRNPPKSSSESTGAIYAREWLTRFRSQFDEEAGDPRTALGLFYERRRRYVAVPGYSAGSATEYSYEEWNRTFATFLASLAREFGLVQAAGWTDVPQLMWFWHGVPDPPAVTIREVKVAGDAIVQQEIPSVVKSGALLTVLVMYPDSPPPSDSSSVDSETERWRAKVADELARVGLTREFLLTTISAFDWEIPAPWKGFAWCPNEHAMVPVE